MFISLQVLLATSVLTSGGDTVRKKTAPEPAPAPTSPAKTASVPAPEKKTPAGTLVMNTPVSQAGAPRATNPARKPLLGAVIGAQFASVAHAVTPHAAYLTNALTPHRDAGPPLPPNIRANPTAVPIHADSIVVEKSHHTMTLYDHGTPVRIYFVALGQSPVGKKMSRGDNRTPEGLYYIDGHNPASKYHLSLKVSYPNAQDIAEAQAHGYSVGGDIMIHGLPKGFEDVGAEHRQHDWTNGCIAVTNAEIEEIWTAIPDGAAIHIKP
jgi:L,D-transpeptidase-like protein